MYRLRPRRRLTSWARHRAKPWPSRGSKPLGILNPHTKCINAGYLSVSPCISATFGLLSVVELWWKRRRGGVTSAVSGLVCWTTRNLHSFGESKRKTTWLSWSKTRTKTNHILALGTVSVLVLRLVWSGKQRVLQKTWQPHRNTGLCPPHQCHGVSCTSHPSHNKDRVSSKEYSIPGVPSISFFYPNIHLAHSSLVCFSAFVATSGLFRPFSFRDPRFFTPNFRKTHPKLLYLI